MATIISTSTTTGIVLTDTALNPVSVTGTIDVASGVALYGQGGGTNSWTIGNAGSISSTGANFGDAAIALGAVGTPVTNGVVTNEAGGVISGRNGVYINGPGSVTNLGGTGGLPGGSITGGNVGIDLVAGGSVTNFGSISGSFAGVGMLGGNDTVNNAGTILALGQFGIGVQLSGTVQNVVINSGSISGGIRGPARSAARSPIRLAAQ